MDTVELSFEMLYFKHAIPLLYAPLCKTGYYPMFIYVNLCNKLQIYTQYIDVHYSHSITRGK
jgi:hypothetical protein